MRIMSVSSSHVGRSTVFFTAGALFSAGCVTEGQPVLCAGVVACPTAEFCITAEVVGAGNRVTAYAASLIAVVRRVLMAQVQYSMWVTRKDAWYFANYDPRMKREGLHYVVVERDEKYMASFDEMVPEFIEKMDEALAEIGFVFGEQWR